MKNIKKILFGILAFVYGICAIAITLTYKGPLTLLYATASMLYTFSIWQKNNKLYRFLVCFLCERVHNQSL